MVFWIAALPLVFVWLYFWLNRRTRADETWQLFREQQRKKRAHSSPDSSEPIHPDFQFGEERTSRSSD